MKQVKKLALAGAGLASISYMNIANAQIAVDTTYGQNITTQEDLVANINRWIGTFFNLLYIIAVVYGLYGGFLILTAGGDEDKVGKGKKVIINAIIGLIVIFLVGSLMRVVINILTGQPAI